MHLVPLEGRVCKMEIGRPYIMNKLNQLILKSRVWTDVRGQDLVEYSLMSGFVALAASAIIPGISVSVSKIFSSVASSMHISAQQS
jgi:Flp pilus assembly pilin Flp